MQIELINIGLAFIEGLALIISPCILPILPLILSGSLTGSKLRPFGIITGFIVTFTMVTLFSRAIVQYTPINQDLLRNLSFGILLLLGIVMMSRYLTDKFSLATQNLSRVGSSSPSLNSGSGFLGGLWFGGLIGIIWTPCAGPILAAVIVQVVIQRTTYSSLLLILAFAIGAGLPMLLIAIIGRNLVAKLSFLGKKAILFRQLLGLILVLTVVYLVFFPDLGNLNLAADKNNPVQTNPGTLIHGIGYPYKAPAIEGIDAWINSKPLNWDVLKGKVVLVDFWTYSCINCIRTLPSLKAWYAKYHNRGFEIIGVHSPEFQFEHDLNNVKRAVANDGLPYPIAVDNHFVTWQNFKNLYWPAHYLVNKNGEVVYVHFGEGEEGITENNIRYLLGLGNQIAHKPPEENYSSPQTPETYLGYGRAKDYAGTEAVSQDAASSYSFPKLLSVNQWALKGRWLVTEEKIISLSPKASIRIHFKAGKVYLVMGSQAHPVTVKVLINGKAITTGSGRDLTNSQVQVTEERLYSIVELQKSEEAVLDIIAINPGLEVYTFTFGGPS